jgi:iduronate 2-sulfatase
MHRRDFFRNAAVGAAACSMAGQRALAVGTQKNVLMLCVDDLRPVMGCYGGKAISPNMDSFGKTGTLFTNHYVQWPVCGASRASLLGGRRPDTSGIYDNGKAWQVADWQDTCPTMPLHYRNAGYTAEGYGKIYHGKGASPGCGWSQTPWQPPCGWTCYVDWPGARNGTANKQGVKSYRPVYEIYDGPDSRHGDCQTADQVMDALERNRDGRFFIGGGFYKPHLPFVAPKRYWDLYDHDAIDLLDNPGLPDGAADYMYNWSEIHSYGMDGRNNFSHENRPTEDQARTMIHAYYACVSHTDAQIGRILAKLDELGLADSTAVVIWGDHGFHLGDKQRWAKHTQFEDAMRSPLMVRMPGSQGPTGTCKALVETIDIYPSLCDWTGVDAPEHLDGKSFVPVVEGHDREGKPAAYSQIHPVGGANGHLMAYSVRTSNFRYVEWRNPKKGYELVWMELYDHRTDPGETRSVVDEPRYATVAADHAELVQNGYSSLQR